MSRILFLTGSETDRQRTTSGVARYLSTLDRTTNWKIEIGEHKQTRSNEQNAYLWGVVYPTALERLPGWDADDLHEYFLGEHFGWETLEGLGKRRLRPLRRSSKLSVKEFKAHWQFIQRKMAEFGVDIPDPCEKAQVAA